MANDATIGVINEQGYVVDNAGLGWAPLSEPDNKVVNEANKKQNAAETTVINEEKK